MLDFEAEPRAVLVNLTVPSSSLPTNADRSILGLAIVIALRVCSSARRTHGTMHDGPRRCLRGFHRISTTSGDSNFSARSVAHDVAARLTAQRPTDHPVTAESA